MSDNITIYEASTNQHVGDPPNTKSYISLIKDNFPLFEHNESAKLVGCAEFQCRNAARTLLYDEIGKRDIDGYPICITRNEDGKLKATFSGNTHALIIGSTGSGKTTGFVLPFINWMTVKKQKPSMVISDPKNELNMLTANRFIKNGYKVIWLDFQDYNHSDGWNPLTKIFRLYQQYLNIENEVKTVRIDRTFYNQFRGIVFKSQKELDRAIEIEKENILAEVDLKINSISDIVAPVENTKDQYWDKISATLIRGFLWAMLEDSDESCGKLRITEKTYSFDTLIRIYDTFENSNSSLDDHGYFMSRNPSKSKAYQLVGQSIIKLSANTTRSCIVSCFTEKIKKFRDISVRNITAYNTFSFSTLDDDTPTVYFVSYKDEDSQHYDIIGIFLTDLYTSLIALARNKGGSLKNPFYFLLDEFGNFPKFKDFEKVISACRSRNIWFLLIVQSYAQLEKVYESETAKIIIDNLNMHIYFGSCNYETKSAFSRECGQHSVISPLSALNSSGSQIERYEKEIVPLVPISTLDSLTDGECIITRMKSDVIRSSIERSYTCPEYDNGISEIKDRKSPIEPYDKSYIYNTSELLKNKGCS